MGDLTEHFSRHEFACKCGCGLDCIYIPLVHFIEALRYAAGGGRMTITSGCRCYYHNIDVGGRPKSRHLPERIVGWKDYGECCASDVTSESCPDTRQLYVIAQNLDCFSGLIGYEKKGIVHADVWREKKYRRFYAA